MKEANMMESTIVAFCVVPRSLKDVCLAYGMVSSTGYDVLRRMVQDGLLEEVYEPSTGAVLFKAA